MAPYNLITLISIKRQDWPFFFEIPIHSYTVLKPITLYNVNIILSGMFFLFTIILIMSNEQLEKVIS